jgi:hypothetical protein
MPLEKPALWLNCDSAKTWLHASRASMTDTKTTVQHTEERLSPVTKMFIARKSFSAWV